jgi:hypothetical protein
MAGGDENSPQDMGMFIRNVSELRHDTQAHITIVHHGTKASNGSTHGSTPRGHSSLTGADDALIEVVKLDDGSRVATVVHAKDDQDGMRRGFTSDVVALGTDDDGDAITTLLVSEKAEPSPSRLQRSWQQSALTTPRCSSSRRRTGADGSMTRVTQVRRQAPSVWPSGGHWMA